LTAQFFLSTFDFLLADLFSGFYNLTYPKKHFMPDLNDAIILAAQVHKKQKDKGGGNYILHPLRLMLRCDNEAEMTTAVLHDVVEDGEVTLEQLRRMGFPEEVISAVGLLTFDKKEDYSKYIDRLSRNPLARKIKILDLEDNLNISRMKKFNFPAMIRTKLYVDAYMKLNNIEIEEQHTGIGH